MTEQPKQNILILGSTGWIGTYITAAIVSSKHQFQRITIFTSPSTLEKKADLIAGWKAQGVSVVTGDLFKDEDVVRALEEGKPGTIVSALGRAVIARQTKILDLILEHERDVTRFLPSEFGTDIEFGPGSKDEPPHQQKLAVRAHIKKLESEGKLGKLRYTYVVTGPFAYGFLSNGGDGSEEKMQMGGFDVKTRRAVVLGDGKGRVSLTSEKDVGKLVVKTLLADPSSIANRALKVNSLTTTPLDIVSEFQRQTSPDQNWDITYVPLDQAREIEKKAYENKEPRATGFTLRRIWAEGGTLYEKRDNHVVGAESGMDSLEDVVKVVVDRQTSNSGEKLRKSDV